MFSMPSVEEQKVGEAKDKEEKEEEGEITWSYYQNYFGNWLWAAVVGAGR